MPFFKFANPSPRNGGLKYSQMQKYYLDFQSPQKGYDMQLVALTNEHLEKIETPIDKILSLRLCEDNKIYLSIADGSFGELIGFPYNAQNWAAVEKILTVWRFLREDGLFANLYSDWQLAIQTKQGLYPQYF